MAERVPRYQFDPPEPVEIKPGVRLPLSWTILEETTPGSKQWRPRDLSGLSAKLSVYREDPVGSGTLIADLDLVAMTISAPTTGVVEYLLNEGTTFVRPDVDRLGEIVLYSGLTPVDRIPRGRNYIRFVVGRPLTP